MASFDEIPNDLQALRELVAKRHTAVTKKISRIRRVHDVDVGGTRLDPRRVKQNIKRYTRSQLQSYLQELNTFQSRSVGFIPDNTGKPIQSAKWRRYKALERLYNRQGRAFEKKIGDTFLPFSGMTIAERMSAMTPDFPTAGGAGGNKMFRQINRRASSIRGEKALDKFIRDMERRLSPDFRKTRMKQIRREINQMLDMIDSSDLSKATKGLTNEQLQILWEYTPFANAMGGMYEAKRSMSLGRKQRWYDQTTETYRADALEWIGWAKSLKS